MNNQTLVVGIGNILRGDDGIGPKIVEWLKENVMEVDYLIASDLFSLLDMIANYRRVVVIDAVNMNAPPGTVKLFTPQDIALKTNSISSTHGFSLADIIKLAALLNLETNLQIIGIQANNISFNNELSLALQKQWNIILTQVTGFL